MQEMKDQQARLR